MTEELPDAVIPIWKNFSKSAAVRFEKIPGAIIQESDVPTEAEEDDDEIWPFFTPYLDDDIDDDETEEDLN
jgi:hypothetical protein